MHEDIGADGVHTITRSRASRVPVRRWVGSLVAVAAIAVLALAGCADGDTTAPTVSARFVSAVGTVVTLELTVSEPGTLFWVAYADGSGPADVLALIADAGKNKNAPIATNSGSNGQAVSAAGTVPVSITDLATNNSYDFYATIRNATGNASSISAKLDITTADTMPPAIVSNAQASGVVCSNSSIMLGWNNPDPTTDDLMSIGITWTTTGDLGRIVGTYVVSSPTEGAAATYAVTNLDAGETYRFSLIATDNANNKSETVTVDAMPATASDADADDDTLIDICNLDMLNNVRCSLNGTSYLTADSGGTCATTDGLLCGLNGTTACTGYELGRNLDFATAADYASGSVNNAWRPTGGDPATATNAGFVPIGTIFASTFEGNNRTISNLYVRSSGDAGLFNALSGTVRNLGVINGAVYGSGNVGIIAAITSAGSNTTITTSYATGTANGGGSGDDAVGGLVGNNTANSIITASYTTATANGGSGADDTVGGLVGNNSGTVTASYATGTANGGIGDGDFVGGLAGNNSGIITASHATATATANGGIGDGDATGGLVGINTGTVTASYATGTANGGAGDRDNVGGLVGVNSVGTITASYATGTANGGAGTNDNAGGLIGGSQAGTITASYATGNADGGADGSDTAGALIGGLIEGTLIANYGFGTATGETAGYNGSTPTPDSAAAITSSNATGWSTAAGGAWNFGTPTQPPALKYTDYDGAGTAYNCNQFPAKIPGTDTVLVCGTSLLPGQER